MIIDMIPPEAALRVGILGAGTISDTHARILKRVPGVSLVAVCDKERSRAAILQRNREIPEIYESSGSMLKNANLNVVHILTPPLFHAETAIECMESGCNVFIEKPLCISLSECHRLHLAASHHARKLGVNHSDTWMRSFLQLIREIRNCRLGRIEHVTVCYNFPLPDLSAGRHGHFLFQKVGNLVFELGSHPNSLIYRLLGKVVTVSTVASGPTTLSSGLPFYDTWQASLTCERGTAQFFLSVGGGYGDFWLHVVGQDGVAMVDLRRDILRLTEKTRFTPPFDDLRDAVGTIRSTFGGAVRHSFDYLLAVWDPEDALRVSPMYRSINAFYEALRNGQAPPVGIEEGTAVVAACEAIVQSGQRFLEETVVHEYTATR
jgi:predicted dehydrogenase